MEGLTKEPIKGLEGVGVYTRKAFFERINGLRNVDAEVFWRHLSGLYITKDRLIELVNDKNILPDEKVEEFVRGFAQLRSDLVVINEQTDTGTVSGEALTAKNKAAENIAQYIKNFFGI